MGEPGWAVRIASRRRSGLPARWQDGPGRDEDAAGRQAARQHARLLHPRRQALDGPRGLACVPRFCGQAFENEIIGPIADDKWISFGTPMAPCERDGAQAITTFP